jgi:hypothetical protein
MKYSPDSRQRLILKAWLCLRCPWKGSAAEGTQLPCKGWTKPVVAKAEQIQQL